MDEETWTTLDSFVSGFLVTRDFTPTLIPQSGSKKVAFSFPATPELYRALREYNDGATVCAVRFAASVKMLKSQIFSMRKSEEERHDDRLTRR